MLAELEQVPEKKLRIEELPENAKLNDTNLSVEISTEESKKGIGNSPSLSHGRHHRPLPLELECEIFKCLKFPIQCKFIWGMGRGIYGMFGLKLLRKSKRLQNPMENRFTGFDTKVQVSEDGLNVNNNEEKVNFVFAEKAFPISVEYCRKDNFPGTIVNYFEITKMSSSKWSVGSLQVDPGV